MLRLNTRAARAVAAVLTAILVPSLGIAQMTRGSIAGTARDSSGAIVPGATVTVTNAATNAAHTAVTDAQGFYRVAALEPGRYTVTTELQSFRRVEQRDVDVRAALETPLDVRLEPGGLDTTVNVTADAGTA